MKKVKFKLTKTEQRTELAIDHTKEDRIVKAIEDLTYSVNTMIYATLADSEAARNIVIAKLAKNE
ncbi:MAG: hypothetical protein WAJ93_05755 [Candidatus Nitrosopolaris sp.]|jgi:hypothetical protein